MDTNSDNRRVHDRLDGNVTIEFPSGEKVTKPFFEWIDELDKILEEANATKKGEE